jgi:tetratricopeptide (TPR) repeat protein
MTIAASAVALLLWAGGNTRVVPPASAFERLSKQADDARTAGRLDEAIGFYGQALRLKPDWLAGHWSLATILYERDAYAEAREHFTRVVDGQPEDGLALAMKALCESRLRNYDLALRELQQASTLGVPNEEVRSVAAFHLALLLNRAGQPDAAFAILRSFATKGEDNPAVLEAFGLSMLRLRFMPEEIPAEKRPMIALAGRGGFQLARGRRTPVGRLALEELVSRYPAEPHVHYALGVYITPDDPDGAIEEFRRELRAFPDHYLSRVRIAMIEIDRGNAERALPLGEEAVRLAPEVPAARLTLGRALLALGQTDRAIEELEKAAALAPDGRDIFFALARAYQRAGRAAEAERARQQFLKLDRAPTSSCS